MDGERRNLRSIGMDEYPSMVAARAKSTRFRFSDFSAAGRTFFAFLPLSFLARLPKGFGAFLTFGVFAVVLCFGANRGGQFDAFVARYGAPWQVIARVAGLGLETITISGLSSLDERTVLSAAGITPRDSVLFTDVDLVRDRLLALPVVKDVAVRKYYPSALSIGIVERDAYALWQYDGRLSVISADGQVLGLAADPSVAGLPLVVGEGASARIREFTALFETCPSLVPVVRAGVLVGQRRWMLHLVNGLDVQLPEEGAPVAMDRLAKLVGEHKLLEKDILSVDLRQADRVVLRLSDAAMEVRTELLKVRAKAKGGAV